MAKSVIGLDVETAPNFFMVGMKRFEDGKRLKFVKRPGHEFDAERLEKIIRGARIVTFNGRPYDMPMVWAALRGANCHRLKELNDQIILGNVRHWEVEDLLGFGIPRTDHIDMIEPQPNAIASLKTLNGRLHGRTMRDLPYHPDQWLSDYEIDQTIDYNDNDLDATELLYHALIEPLELREAIGRQYGMNVMSSSDSQIGEAIVKKRVEQITGEKAERVETRPGTVFHYKPPEYLSFQRPDLREMLERLKTTRFIVQPNGKVELPEWLEKNKVVIGSSTYTMGIGGLHSNEKKRTLWSDDDNVLIDFDVASYYPSILLGSGLYPLALGPVFLEVYRAIRDERIRAKRAGEKVTAESLKIALNGVFGKLGSRYSILYAPHLMVAVTLTGQLALLMLIERAEAAGIPAVSGNTDGVVFHCPRDREADLKAITRQWEVDTGFELEDTRYKSLHSASVNTYFAIKEDGKAKRKGTVANPWAEKDMRSMLMKNPNATICSDAALAFIKDAIPLEQTIRGCSDIRQFVTVRNVQGGGTWRGDYLGKVVRYYWAIDGEPLFYKRENNTGGHSKVQRTDGAAPIMTLPDELPDDIDYDRYLAEARAILIEVGFTQQPITAKKATIRGRHQAFRYLLANAILD